MRWWPWLAYPDVHILDREGIITANQELDLDVEARRCEIRKKGYAEVAHRSPDKGFHFHTGRPLTRMLGLGKVSIMLPVVIVSVLLTIGLAACGGTESPAPTATPSSTPWAVPESWEPAQRDYFASVRNAFQRHVTENEVCLEKDDRDPDFAPCLTRTWRALHEALDFEPPSVAGPARDEHVTLRDAVGAMLALHERAESEGDAAFAADGPDATAAFESAFAAWFDALEEIR